MILYQPPDENETAASAAYLGRKTAKAAEQSLPGFWKPEPALPVKPLGKNFTCSYCTVRHRQKQELSGRDSRGVA